jgi:3-phosphoshikimate 1-carboxyvinyltransferase
VSDARAVQPITRPLDAAPPIPGSRSITNRALVCAALADGRSSLLGALGSDDTEAMVDCVTTLGATCAVDGDRIDVDGFTGSPRTGPASLHTRLSGTTSRFVLPMCTLGHGDYTIDAAGPMRRRPMADGIDALRSVGARIDDTDGHLPLVVHADGLAGGRVVVGGDVSSQFLSGLLLSAPAMTEGLEVTVGGELKSRPYVEMTVAVMSAFGAIVEERGDRWRVEGVGYVGRSYPVEPDASTACYFLAAAAIAGGRIRIDGIGSDSIQGDAAFVDVLVEMGCEVVSGPDHVELVRGGDLVGTDVDLSDMSDQAPTFAAVAAFATTPSSARGIGFIRRKESDRIGGTVECLRRLGVEADELGDGFAIRPSTPHGARLATHDDHRMAMSFALVGLRVPGVEIEDPSVVDKTFPGFWDALDGLTTADLTS